MRSSDAAVNLFTTIKKLVTESEDPSSPAHPLCRRESSRCEITLPSSRLITDVEENVRSEYKRRADCGCRVVGGFGSDAVID